MPDLAFTRQPHCLLSAPPSLMAKTLKATMVVSLHVLMLLLALRATGLISHQALPSPMVLSVMVVAAPAQPVMTPKTTRPHVTLPPLRQGAIAIADSPVTRHVVVTEAPQIIAAQVTPTPTPPPQAETITLTEARVDVVALSNPAPAYSLMSRRNGEAGKVVLLVQVSKQGTAAHVEIKQSCGFARLDAAALEAVRKWRFIPARRGDEAVAASLLVPLIFKLDS